MSECIISVKNLCVDYENTPVLTDVCFNVEKGEFLGIIGPNGGGKTTLLKTMLGIITPRSGSVTVAGHPAGKTGGLIGYVPQFAAIDYKFPISVTDAVLSGLMTPGIHPFFRYTSEHRKLAAEALGKVGLSSYAGRQISELSGGEFQRLLIARAIVSSPPLLFLDEPTASVDPGYKESIFDLLGKLNADMTVILVTHDIMAVSSHVSTLACLNRTLVYHGDPSLDSETTHGLYGCPVELIAHGVPHVLLDAHGEDKKQC